MTTPIRLLISQVPSTIRRTGGRGVSPGYKLPPTSTIGRVAQPPKINDSIVSYLIRDIKVFAKPFKNPQEYLETYLAKLPPIRDDGLRLARRIAALNTAQTKTLVDFLTDTDLDYFIRNLNGYSATGKLHEATQPLSTLRDFYKNLLPKLNPARLARIYHVQSQYSADTTLPIIQNIIAQSTTPDSKVSFIKNISSKIQDYQYRFVRIADPNISNPNGERLLPGVKRTNLDAETVIRILTSLDPVKNKVQIQKIFDLLTHSLNNGREEKDLSKLRIVLGTAAHYFELGPHNPDGTRTGPFGLKIATNLQGYILGLNVQDFKAIVDLATKVLKDPQQKADVFSAAESVLRTAQSSQLAPSGNIISIARAVANRTVNVEKSLSVVTNALGNLLNSDTSGIVGALSRKAADHSLARYIYELLQSPKNAGKILPILANLAVSPNRKISPKAHFESQTRSSSGEIIYPNANNLGYFLGQASVAINKFNKDGQRSANSATALSKALIVAITALISDKAGSTTLGLFKETLNADTVGTLKNFSGNASDLINIFIRAAVPHNKANDVIVTQSSWTSFQNSYNNGATINLPDA